MRKQQKKILAIALGGLVGLLLIIQILPVERENPPVGGELQAPAEVLSILERACYDCHSNQTSWPWYSRIAPVSWMVADHVEEGREHLNFSEWDSYALDKQTHKIEEVWEEIEEGEMPLWQYTLIHRDAVLSDQEKETIRQWSQSVAGAEETEEHEEHEH